MSDAHRPCFFVGPWDLNRELAVVPEDPRAGSVLFVESVAKGRALPYHRKKLVLVLSATHHFARELREAGYDVSVVNAPTYVEGIRRHVEERGSSRVVAMQPREWGLQRALEDADAEGALGAPLTMLEDGGEGGHFLLAREAFLSWAKGRKTLRMDQFYRWMRKRTGWLMDGGKPVGGKWSFDADNRKTPKKGVRPPKASSYPPDALTTRIMERVAGWPGHWGEVEGFDWPVTRADALEELRRFVDERLPRFGDYQDAMLADEPFMWHLKLSPAMNLGLVHPDEVVAPVVEAWERGDAPLNAVEGFVRQVIGWREFIRGVYWLRMPHLREANLLGAQRPLPAFFWEPDKTRMRCMSQSVATVQRHGYAHHIQRLMVLGNFALLAGIAPLEISHWFWAGFVDAFEWVELPNVHGMAVYADDAFTTKPYAASASYIHRMSDYCGGCAYDRKARSGEGACPFNALYWDFMARHRERLESNPRVAVLYRAWDRWSDDERAAIRDRARSFLDGLEPSDHGWRFADDQC